jgi:hypothetical protein
MKRRQRTFFEELRHHIKNQFWDELERAIWRDACEELDREEKRNERRARNREKAKRIWPRLQRVREFDLWAAVAHYDEHQLWGQHDTDKFDAYKSLHAKRERIMWTLTALWYYWQYGSPYLGSNPRKGLKYSAQRKLYDKHFEELLEKVRQDKWDRKRERVKKRRQAKEERERAKAEAKDPKAKALRDIMKLRGVSRTIIDKDDLNELAEEFHMSNWAPSASDWGEWDDE